MILADITLKGFRNYKDAHIKLEKNTLIIGANDVGKTNLIWAMRLLLDRSLSDYDIEPRSSDFYVLEETNSFVILLHFTDITEECVLSKLRGKISDANEMYMSYNASRDPNTGKISYTIKAGASVELLSDIEAHYYRKYLNIKYISCRRDLYAFISKERNFLFQNAKESRSTQEEEEDNTLLQEIKTKLQEANNLIQTLHYISKATNSINSELKEMSIYNNNQDVYFDTAYSIKHMSPEQLVRMIHHHGSDKILFGSDAPWTSQKADVEKLRSITDLSTTEKQQIFYQNAQRLLGR